MTFQINRTNDSNNNNNEPQIDRKDLLAFNGMILTGMLFLLGLSSEIAERKLILYTSLIPFFGFMISSVVILSNHPSKMSVFFKMSKHITIISLFGLVTVLFVVGIDVVVYDNTISKAFDELFIDNNNSETNSNNNSDINIDTKK
jgi:hypothetical protein